MCLHCTALRYMSEVVVTYHRSKSTSTITLNDTLEQLHLPAKQAPVCFSVQLSSGVSQRLFSDTISQHNFPVHFLYCIVMILLDLAERLSIQ